MELVVIEGLGGGGGCNLRDTEHLNEESDGVKSHKDGGDPSRWNPEITEP